MLQQHAFSICCKRDLTVYRSTGNLAKKDIMSELKIDKTSTFHTSRHTAATVVFLSNKVSMENIAKILGHKSTKMTQRYVKVIDCSIKRDIKNVIKTMDF